MTGRRTGARRSLVVALLAGALVLAPVAPTAAATKPGKPKILKVFVKGTGTLKAKWSTGRKATRYQVLVATNKKMTKGRKVLKAKSRSKTITGLRQGTTYYVKVRSYRGTKKSGWSPRKSARTLYATPSTPRISARGTGYASAVVSWTPASYATRYRVVVTRGPGMAVLQRTPWQVGRAKGLVNLRALPAGSFYYARVEVTNAYRASRYSAPAQILLRPYSPRGGKVVASAPGGLTATWYRATNAQRYEVMARSRLTQVERISATNKLGEGLGAVNGLAANQTHDVFVRAVTGSWRTPWVAAGTGVPKAARYSLQVGSYNVHCANPGTRCSTVHRWSTRKRAVADLINRYQYDVVGTQETSTDPVGSGVSQGVDLDNLLDDRYTYGAHSNGRWIYYDKNRLAEVADGAFKIGYSTGTRKDQYAVWQVFRHRATGEEFAVVNAHMDSYIGYSYDQNRLSQTRTLLAETAGVPEMRGLPIIHVGDYNSHEFRTYDGPRAGFLAADYLDSDDFAATKVKWTFNSANGWRSPAPQQAAHTDHVYVPRTVGVRGFGVDLDATSTGRWTRLIPSDHNPVRAILDMPAS